MRRWVLDTNVLINALLTPRSTSAQALAQALSACGKLLVSHATLAELSEVLARTKFDRYVSRETRKQFLIDLMPVVELVPESLPIRACRDPKDDKFLEVAVHGQADALVTGDADLLALNPFHGVSIVAPAQFLGGLPVGRPAFTSYVQEPRARYAVRGIPQ